MIKFLKKLWKKCFNRVGDSRIKTEVKAVKNTPTATPVLILEPKPIQPKPIQPKPIQPESLHCANHIRFKKSCPACQGVTK